MSDCKHPNLLIIGTHQAHEGYPNTLYRLRALHNCTDLQVEEICVPLTSGWENSNRLINMALISLRLIGSHATMLCRYLLLMRRPDIAYIPYPAIIVSLLFSFLPRCWRPKKIVVDAFISLHDTLVSDRKLLNPGSTAARLLFWIEQRGYSFADLVIVDTAQNADFLAQKFNLPLQKFHAIPLSTNEQDYLQTPYQPGEICKVLFIGTMIPLHGIDTILQAAKILTHNKKMHFLLIGNGQESHQVESALAAGLDNLTWQSAWQSASQLAAEIKQSDICLGIFGTTEKTQRVCPLKLYSYFSVGRAVVTGSTKWTRYVLENGQQTLFETVPTGNALALAEKIEQLANADEYRAKLATEARQFYEAELSNQRAEKLLHQLLTATLNAQDFPLTDQFQKD